MTHQPSPGKVRDHARAFSLGTFRMAGPSQIAFVWFPCHTQFNRYVGASSEPGSMPGTGSLFSGAQSLVRQTHKWTTFPRVTSVIIEGGPEYTRWSGASNTKTNSLGRQESKWYPR